jgi:hypothetical protein
MRGHVSDLRAVQGRQDRADGGVMTGQDGGAGV